MGTVGRRSPPPCCGDIRREWIRNMDDELCMSEPTKAGAAVLCSQGGGFPQGSCLRFSDSAVIYRGCLGCHVTSAELHQS